MPIYSYVALKQGKEIVQGEVTASNLKDARPWKKSYDKPTQSIKKQRYYFANKGPYSQSYDFSSSYI